MRSLNFVFLNKITKILSPVHQNYPVQGVMQVQGLRKMHKFGLYKIVPQINWINLIISSYNF